MSTCEQCWNDAYLESRLRGTSQVDEYLRLLEENPNGHDMEGQR